MSKIKHDEGRGPKPKVKNQPGDFYEGLNSRVRYLDSDTDSKLFITEWTAAIGSTFGILSKAFKDPYEEPPLSHDVLTLEQIMNKHKISSSGAEKILSSHIAKREEEIITRKQDLNKIFHHLLALLRPSALATISRHPDYVDIDKAEDPIKLWILINTSVLSGVDSFNYATALMQAKRGYYHDSYQYVDENPIDFIRRFEDAYETLKKRAVDTKSDHQLAMDLFDRLHPSTYAELIYDIKNMSRINIEGITFKEMCDKIKEHSPKEDHVVKRNVSNFHTDAPKPSDATGPNAGCNSCGCRCPKSTTSTTPKPPKNGNAGQPGPNAPGPNGKKKNPKNGKDTEPADIQSMIESAVKKVMNTYISKQVIDAEKEKSQDILKDQPDDDDDIAALHKAYSTFVKSQNKNFSTLCLLDNCSTISIFRSKMLSNIRPLDKPITVSGVGGAVETIATLQGDLDGFFTVYCCDDIAVNILSYAEVKEWNIDISESEDKYTIHLNGKDLCFNLDNRLYVADMADWSDFKVVPQRSYSTFNSESGYTKDEIARAKEAYKFAINNGLLSLKATIDQINFNEVTGAKFTSKDVIRAFELYGRHPAAIKGTDMKEKPTRAVQDDLRPLTNPPQTACSDIFYAKGIPFLITVLKPLGLILTTKLINRSTKTVVTAILNHLSTCASHRFYVSKLYVDPEKSLAVLKGNLLHIVVDVSGAGDHLPMVDERIKSLKKIARSYIFLLEWEVPPNKVEYLIYFSTYRLNMVRGTLPIAPRIAFTGNKPSMNREFSMRIGTYCEVHDNAAVSNSITSPRTQSCIALYPTGNSNGSWFFWHLATDKIIVRSNYTIMPMSDTILNIINRLNFPSGKPATVDLLDEITPVPSQANSTSEEADTKEKVLLESDTKEKVPLDSDIKEKVPSDSTNELENTTSNSVSLMSPEIVSPLEPVPKIAESTTTIEPDAPVNPAVTTEPTVSTITVPTRTRGMKNPLPSGVKPRNYTKKVYHISIKRGLMQYGKIAENAMFKEVKQMHDKDVFEYSISSFGHPIIRSHGFYKEKMDAMGIFQDLKARLVADGSSQVYELYSDTSSPTVKSSSILSVLKIAVLEDRITAIFDIGGAYLHADMDETVYISLEPDVASIMCKVDPTAKQFLQKNGSLIVKLKKALYGLKRSGLLWYRRLSAFLIKLGFAPNHIDPCCFNIIREGMQLSVLFHVDDLLVTSADNANIMWLRDMIKAEFSEIKEQSGDNLMYLGMSLKKQPDGHIKVSMDAMIDSLTENISKYAPDPASESLFTLHDNYPLLSDKLRDLFHSVTAKLLYLGRMIRPDILLAVSFLTTRVTAPTLNDLIKLQRLLAYLAGSKDLSINISNTPFTQVSGMIDAAFANHYDARSHTGYVVLLGDTPVIFGSGKQKILTANSTEAELVGLSDKYLYVIEIHDFLIGQGLKLDTPVIFQDNQSTIAMIQTNSSPLRNKYMFVRQQILKSACEEKLIKLAYLPTRCMIADILTKALHGKLFKHLRSYILGESSESRKKVRVIKTDTEQKEVSESF